MPAPLALENGAKRKNERAKPPAGQTPSHGCDSHIHVERFELRLGLNVPGMWINVTVKVYLRFPDFKNKWVGETSFESDDWPAFAKAHESREKHFHGYLKGQPLH